MQNIVSNHNRTKLEINNRRKIYKYLEVKQHTYSKWIKEEVTREITKYFELNEDKNTTYQHL